MDLAHTAAGLALALAAAGCVESGYVLQAAEARAHDAAGAAASRARPSASGRPRLPLLAALAARPGWRGGTALVVAGTVLQLAALAVAPVSLVQPTLILGLGLLVLLAERRLGERPGTADRLGVAAAGVGALLVALGGTGAASSPSVAARALTLGALAAVLVLASAVGARGHRPRWAVAAAGAGDALAVLAAKLMVDDLTAGHWAPAAAWGVLAAGAGLLGLSAEMRALQVLPATTVGPLVLAAQAAVPVLLAPVVVGEHWNAPVLVAAGTLAVTGAALVLGRRREAIVTADP